MTTTMPAAARPVKNGNDPLGARAICDALHLFRICAKDTCRRAGACRGKGQLCIGRHAKIVPDEVWEWVAGILEGRELDLTQEEIMEHIDPLKGAYFGWIAGLYAGLAARQPRGP